MSQDIEQELRELFRDKAGRAPVATPDVGTTAPQEVLRRGRLHQIGTVIGSLVAVLVVVAGSVAGMSSLLRGRDTVGGGAYEVFERTATIEAFTVTSPSDWFLVNEWPRSMATAVGSGSSSGTCTIDPSGNQACSGDAEPVDPIRPSPNGLPMIQLSNRDLGLTGLACGGDLPADGAVLYVAHSTQEIPGLTTQFAPWSGGTLEKAVGPCGAGSYTTFTVHDEPFFAWVGVGGAASDQDRATVMDAFASMAVDDSWRPAEPDQATPAYVIAGGFAHGEPWRLELRPSDRNVELTLIGDAPWGAQADFDVPATPIQWCCTDDGLIEVTFGAVTKEATGVEVRPSDASSPIPATIIPLPPSLPFAFDVFFVDGTDGLTGRAIALGLGNDVTEPPPAEPRAETTELSGSFDGQEWTVRFTGSFAEETACIQPFLSEEPLDRLCPRPLGDTLTGRLPHLSGWLTSFYLLAGAVPPEIEEIRFVQGNAVVPAESACGMGPLGWTDPDRKVCAIALPPEGAGSLEYLDAAGTVVFEENIGWSAAEPDQVPTTTVATAGSLEMTARMSPTEGLCLAIPDYDLTSCSRTGPPLTMEALSGDTLSERDRPAILIWGAVSTDVAEIQINGSAFSDELKVGDLTHESFPGISFVLYVAPEADVGDPCELNLTFVDQDGSQMGASEALTGCAA
jgi:hypothetical protein